MTNYKILFLHRFPMFSNLAQDLLVNLDGVEPDGEVGGDEIAADGGPNFYQILKLFQII